LISHSVRRSCCRHRPIYHSHHRLGRWTRSDYRQETARRTLLFSPCCSKHIVPRAHVRFSSIPTCMYDTQSLLLLWSYLQTWSQSTQHCIGSCPRVLAVLWQFCAATLIFRRRRVTLLVVEDAEKVRHIKCYSARIATGYMLRRSRST
jgi:hypothetical protein